MERLTETSVGELQEALDSVEQKTPAQRLIAAIAYKNGITQSELAEWFRVERKTIYNWLTRIEERDLESAILDEHRPGRPRKLSDDQFETLQSILMDPPSEVGFDRPTWTTGVVREFIRDEFNIDYSLSSCRRIMRQAGLRYMTRAVAGSGSREETERQEGQSPMWLPRES